MKKCFTAITVVFFAFIIFLSGLAQAAPQAEDGLAGSKRTSYAYVENSADATVTLVSAVTGMYVSLYSYTLSTSSADNFYFKCGSTQMTAKKYLGTNSGLESNMYPLYIRCGSGEALSLVKGTAATPIGIDFWYSQQK